MSCVPRWRRYARFFGLNVPADVDDELRFHFDSRIEELTAEGLSPSAARTQAHREFGDCGEVRRTLVRIDRRRARRVTRRERLDDVLSDLSYAARSLSRAPGLTAAVLTTLSLGVGANAAMFTLIDTLFLRAPAGVVAPDGVRRVWTYRKFLSGGQFYEAYSYLEFQSMAQALADRGTATVYRPPAKTSVGTGESAVEARVSYAAAGYFPFLGVRAQAGRFYTAEEDALDAPASVAVLSDAYWRRTYGGAPDAIGRTIRISGQIYRVIGVAAAPFAGTDLDAADVWLPLSLIGRGYRGDEPWWKNRNVNGMTVLVRPAGTRSGADPRELEARLTTALRRTRDEMSTTPSRSAADSSRLSVRFGSIVRANGPGEKSKESEITLGLGGVAIMVLLIACANVINLLLARAVHRRREIAVRLALGISRARLFRLLLAESALLSLAAAVIAVAVAYAGGMALRALLLPDVHWATSPVDGHVLFFAIGVALTAGLAAGLVPAIQSASPRLVSALKSGPASSDVHRSRLRGSLVVTQAALSVVLLVGALLFVRSLANVRALDIGFDARRLVTVSARFDDRSAYDAATFGARLQQLADAMAAVPGIERVALSSAEPMAGFSIIKYYTDTDSLRVRPGWMPTVTAISGGYFDAAGVRVVRGSDFPANRQLTNAPFDVVVNEAMEKGAWRGRNAIGQCLWFGSRASPCYRVRAVVEDSRMRSVIETEPAPKLYVPLDNVPRGNSNLAPYYVVARVSPQRFAEVSAVIRNLVQATFPGGAPRITRLSDYIEPQYRPWRLGATLFSAFGGLALVVAMLGVYSTISCGVNQRWHEFGVRAALGARSCDVLRLVVGQGLRLLLCGVAAGVILSLIMVRWIAAMLYGIRPSDPASLAIVVVGLVSIGLIAALVPAWRAASVDPVTALRVE